MELMLSRRNYRKLQEGDCYQIWEKPCGKGVYVCTASHSKITISIFKLLMARLKELGLVHMIVCYIDDVTSNVREFIKSSIEEEYTIECFSTNELDIDIVTHSLQPKFRVLDPCAAQNIIQRYGRNSIPRILRTDPLSRYYNWPPGTVIEIDDMNRPYYRIVQGRAP